jgi:rRNA-processing protein FCF1
MNEQLHIRSISFDTSFLLKDDISIDMVIKIIARDKIPCYVTATVASELEQLKIWGRITEADHKKAIHRWLHAHATIIDFKNRLLSDTLGTACRLSMQNHGIDPNHVINDCTILVSNLRNGVDLFLSEDFHFTSAITREVIQEIQHAACSEYALMCDSRLYSIDAKTFLKAYMNGIIDLTIVQLHMQHHQKKNKLHNPKGKEGGETKHAVTRHADAT